MSISALQVAGISPIEIRSCDFISPSCITLQEQHCIFIFLHGKFNTFDDDDDDDVVLRGRM